MNSVHGLHHVTCITDNPQENLVFYTLVMGMRLVKKSVNQDVPDTYHLFYADGAGTPGTDLTFFPWPDTPTGQAGFGLTVEVAFSIPMGTIPYWRRRFEDFQVIYSQPEHRFGESTLPFRDPDGLRLALVETDNHDQFVPWIGSPVPVESQVQGMHAVRLWERQLAPTAEMLADCLGFNLIGDEDGWHRYGIEGGSPGKLIEIKELPAERRGQWGTGSVHHVAWRVKDTDEQMILRELLVQAGRQPTQQIDRFWFRSVYLREPGGALFELATEGPGFSRDETPEHLGERLILPPWLETQRDQIEAALPPLELKHGIGRIVTGMVNR